MEKKYYALSYNNTQGDAQLGQLAAGEGRPRRTPIASGPRVPAGRRSAGRLQEDRSRGLHRQRLRPRAHVPAADRGSDMDSLKATFVMTNVVPQSHANNAGAWEQFEIVLPLSCRARQGAVRRGRPARAGRRRYEGPRRRHRQRPSRRPGQDVEGRACPESRRRRRCGRPADRAVNGPTTRRWARTGRPFRVSVNAVERLTGYHFFDRADPAVLDPLKEKVDTQSVSPTGGTTDEPPSSRTTGRGHATGRVNRPAKSVAGPALSERYGRAVRGVHVGQGGRRPRRGNGASARRGGPEGGRFRKGRRPSSLRT